MRQIQWLIGALIIAALAIPTAFSQESVMTLNTPELGIHTRALVSFPLLKAFASAMQRLS